MRLPDPVFFFFCARTPEHMNTVPPRGDGAAPDVCTRLCLPSLLALVQLLTATTKLFFKRPPEVQKMLGRLLQRCLADGTSVALHDKCVVESLTLPPVLVFSARACN